MSAYPFEYEELDEKTNEEIKRDFKAYTRGLMRVKPFNHIMGPEFKNYGERIYNMEVRSDDIWVVTFPKTGTTWTQAAIWSILNDGNIEQLNRNPYLFNWRFLEIDALSKDGIDRLISDGLLPADRLSKSTPKYCQFESAINDPSPRLIKTHLPLSLLPPKLLGKAKVVYVARNPKDVCVSYFHHHCFIRAHDFEGTFPEFFKYFVKDLVIQSPFWPHVVEAWKAKNHPNMLFLFYEDMKADFPGTLRKLAAFLNRPITETLIRKLVVELSVEGMKKNPALNAELGKELGIMKKQGSFIRKGIVGDWRTHFTPEMEQEMDEWSRKQRKDCDIRFPGEVLSDEE